LRLFGILLVSTIPDSTFIAGGTIYVPLIFDSAYILDKISRNLITVELVLIVFIVECNALLYIKVSEILILC